MSEALIGVVIGGLIASVAPVCAIILDTRRWKLEKQLERLKEERSRLEQLLQTALPNLGEAMSVGSYPSTLTSDVFVLMPKEVGQRLEAWLEEEDKSDLKGKHAYFEICVEMKKAVANVDKKIDALLNA